MNSTGFKLRRFAINHEILLADCINGWSILDLFTIYYKTDILNLNITENDCNINHSKNCSVNFIFYKIFHKLLQSCLLLLRNISKIRRLFSTMRKKSVQSLLK